MAGKRPSGNPVPVSDLATGILDPMLRKRAGISVGLVQSWEEIVGPRLARMSRPERVQWPRRMNENDPFQPAALIVACEGAAALHIQHQTDEIIGRVNAFFGFAAVGRVKIVQKPAQVARKPPPPMPRALSDAERSRVAHVVGGIEDAALRESLERLGSAVLGSRK